MSRVGIKDVAKEVGVSITTVSRALNGYTDVSEKTKKRILETVERLHYAPNINARSLGGKADTTIAFLVSELMPRDENGFIYGVIKGLFDQCSDMGCEFMLLVTNQAKQEKLSFTQLYRKKNLSGIVVSGLKNDDSYYHEILESDLPCAAIDMNISGENKCKVTIDNVAATMEAMQYLINMGHRNIAMINGSKQADVCSERKDGYIKALRKNNIPLKKGYIRYCDFSDGNAYIEAKKMLKKYPELTAFFCASDMMAIGVARAVEEMGLCIPDDISIMGFDDIPIAKYVYNGITTIRQSPTLMGKESGKAVWDMIQNNKQKSIIILPFELVERNTTAKVRS